MGFADFVVTGYKSRRDWRCLKMGVLESFANYLLFCTRKCCMVLALCLTWSPSGSEVNSRCGYIQRKEPCIKCRFLLGACRKERRLHFHNERAQVGLASGSGVH